MHEKMNNLKTKSINNLINRPKHKNTPIHIRKHVNTTASEGLIRWWVDAG